jgi:hypothetical protein
MTYDEFIAGGKICYLAGAARGRLIARLEPLRPLAISSVVSSAAAPVQPDAEVVRSHH